jgi:DNA-binding NarL/FixJ family response regulator
MGLGNTQFVMQRIRGVLDAFVAQSRSRLKVLFTQTANRASSLIENSFHPHGAGPLMVLVGVQDASLHKIRDFSRDAGAEILLLATTALAASYPISRAQPDHVIIDLETAGGIASAYSDLRKFRDQHPDLPVILLSNEFAGDDFSTDRLALCDISLRAPFSFDALRFALREAVVNNAVWQKRQRDQAQAAHRQA